MNQPELGDKGFDIINDTNPHDGNWFFIKARTDTEFESLKGSKMRLNGSEAPALTSFTLSEGDYLHGDFRHIKLTSGEVIAQAR